jgi:predicted RecB family nuclease
VIALADGTLVLSASDIAAHLACPHLEQQRLAIARGERMRPSTAPDAHAELIRRRGDAHEAAQLARLSAEAGGDVADLSAGFDPRRLPEAAARTAEAVRAGAALIFQPVFFDDRWIGRADFLRRTEDGTYEVLDTKLSRDVKPAVVHQLALYSRLLGAIQGVEPLRAHAILGHGGTETIDLRRFAALHRRVALRVEAAVAAPAVATFPEPVGHCDVCDFAGECRARRVATDHLSLVANARREQRARLVEFGVPTVAALAQAAPRARYELLHRQAALQVRSRETGKPCHRHLEPGPARGYARLPAPSPGDVFFDLEGDPFALPDRGLEYLWGWWTLDGGYDCAWAHDEAAERAALERFVAFVHARLAADPGMHVYHYAPHEISTLRTLATRYATCEEEVDELLRREVLVDLLTVVRQGLQVGEEHYSLKHLERHHGFVREERSVRAGGGSIVAYEEWLETADGALLESIRAYNQDDCRSTHALREWLWGAMRGEAAAEFGADFDAVAEPDEVKPAPAWVADVEALAATLHAAGEDLLGFLLLYHRREGKPSWWRYFDLRGKTPEELVDERDAVGLLTLDATVAPVAVKQSLDWTLAFPAQEFRLDRGGAEDPTTGEGHKVVAVEDDHLVLRRGRGKPPPEPGALIGGGPPDTAVQRNALVELAGSLLAGDGRFAAARALLRREPPRGPLDDLVAATLALDCDVLPVQGPPGTGKTHQGARMVVAALAAGRRVGITAPTHAAIQNLLAAVEARAHEQGVSFSGIYKGGDYASAHGLIESTGGNDGVEDEHDLVAGTAWLFARPDHREAFDVLFVDEAGQYSLADALAVALSTRGMVLLGDPRQLPQVTQAAHPGGSGASVLEHLLDGHATIPPGRGVLLEESWRMHPDVCAFVSERSYDGRLRSRAGCASRRVDAPGPLTGAGLRVLAVEHLGRGQAAPEEADAIARRCRVLLTGGTVTDETGAVRPLVGGDILVVAPYNLAVRTIRNRVPAGVRVGTVDRFQGMEAPIVFFAMTCSSGDDVPRGLDFLFSANRLNVAVSRAQCLAVLVHSPRLLDADCRTVADMALVDGACRFVELARN